ncbi:MAG: hypothetical protein WC761_00265 [Candidatus Paceibacterota bacterium]|jgi:hypothetical protein
MAFVYKHPLSVFKAGALYEIEQLYRVYEDNTLDVLITQYGPLADRGAHVYQYLSYNPDREAYVMYWIEREKKCLIPCGDVSEQKVKEIKE